MLQRARINGDVVTFRVEGKTAVLVNATPENQFIPPALRPRTSGYFISRNEPARFKSIMAAIKSGKGITLLPLVDEAARRRMDARTENRRRDDLFWSQFQQAVGVTSAPESRQNARTGTDWDTIGMCPIIRWVGAQGFGLTDAENVMKQLGYEPNPSTLRIQLRKGKAGDAIPKLDAKQADALKAILGTHPQMTIADVLPSAKPEPVQIKHIVAHGDKVAKLEAELKRREQSQGKSHDVRKMTKLRDNIAKAKASKKPVKKVSKK